MKVKVLRRIGIEGRIYEVGSVHDLPEGIALRKQAQGEVKRIIEKAPEPVTSTPDTTEKKSKKKKYKPAKEDKLFSPEDKADK